MGGVGGRKGEVEVQGWKDIIDLGNILLRLEDDPTKISPDSLINIGFPAFATLLSLSLWESPIRTFI